MKKNPNRCWRGCVSITHHYLLGKLSSCSSAVVSGNKLMCCRDYTESDRNNLSQDTPATNSNTRAHTCALRLLCANTEITESAECYHHVLSSASALYFCFFYRGLRALYFHHHHPRFGPDKEVARRKEDFLFYTSTSVNFIG